MRFHTSASLVLARSPALDFTYFVASILNLDLEPLVETLHPRFSTLLKLQVAEQGRPQPQRGRGFYLSGHRLHAKADAQWFGVQDVGVLG